VCVHCSVCVLQCGWWSIVQCVCVAVRVMQRMLQCILHIACCSLGGSVYVAASCSVCCRVCVAVCVAAGFAV